MAAPTGWTEQSTKDKLDLFEEKSNRCLLLLRREWALSLHEELQGLQKLSSEISEQQGQGVLVPSIRDGLRLSATNHIFPSNLSALVETVERAVEQLGRAQQAFELIKNPEED